MNVYVLLVVIFSLAFSAPIIRFTCNNYCISWLGCIYREILKLKEKLANRKTKFQLEVERIASQYGRSSSSSDLQV